MQKAQKPADRLVKIIEQFPKLSITVLGDLIADEFIYGEIARVSREAPVLILRHRDRARLFPAAPATLFTTWLIWGSRFFLSAL